MAELYAVIMAGGSGTRFWPASREARPKQFLPIAGGRTMLEETVRRLEGLVPLERVLVVTAESQAELVRDALAGLPAENLLAEPCARNTAACVALAALAVEERSGGEAIQIVLPADHVIQPVEEFRATLQVAVEEAAAADVLVTFGIQPTSPATGYGYIEAGDEIGRRGTQPVLSVASFVEKPDLETASGFITSGRHFWNSGMFVWSTRAILAAFREHEPAIPAILGRWRDGEPLAELYPEVPALPVDKAIMERAGNVRLLPVSFRWSDVGSWAALPEVHERDACGNWKVLGPDVLVVSEDSQGCVVYGEGDEVVALVGVTDLVVVRAGNATLVCPRDRAQEVRRVVDALRTQGKRFL